MSSAIIHQHSLLSQSLYPAACQLRTFRTSHCLFIRRNLGSLCLLRSRLLHTKSAAPIITVSDFTKMHALRSLLILLLYLSHTCKTGIAAAELVAIKDPCTSSHPDECSSFDSDLVTHLRRTPPLLPPSEDTFQPQTTLPPNDTMSVPPEPIQISTSTQSLNSTPPLFPSPTARSHLPNPPHTGLQLQAPDLSLSQFDLDQCHKNKHCLLCRNLDTVLTCYKHNCQCQRGHPADRYMAASKESCYESELCLSCPPKSVPFTWGRMAMCLTVFRHRPIKGEENPLTNWTEEGVRSLPVGKVVMSQGSRLAKRICVVMSMAGLGSVTVIYLLMG